MWGRCCEAMEDTRNSLLFATASSVMAARGIFGVWVRHSAVRIIYRPQSIPLTCLGSPSLLAASGMTVQSSA